jgi:serine/threonine protein kinase
MEAKHDSAPPTPCRADQGRLLDCVVRWGSLTEGKIRAHLGEVLEAVRYLHNCRIAHLDLKVGWLDWGGSGNGRGWNAEF